MKYPAGSTFEAAPAGAHAAILYKIVDIGTQKGEYNGEETIRRQVIYTWELPHELMADGRPFTVSKFYTKSLGDQANLTKDLTAWLGSKPDPKTFDDQALLGKACQVIVVANKDTGKVKVTNVAPLPKGLTVPDKTHNDIVVFDLENFDQEVFDSLTKGIQGMIQKSPEYAEYISGGAEFNQTDQKVSDDEIPF